MNPEQLKLILDHFNVGAPVSTHLLTSGLINPTWKIETEHGQFILQKVNSSVFKNPVSIGENIEQLKNFLHRAHPGYLFVASLSTKDHKPVAFLPTDGYYRLFPFIKNSHTIDVVSSPDEAYEAAQQFSKFTSLLEPFDATRLNITIPDFHNLAFRYHQFERSLIEGNQDRIRKAAALVEAVKSYHWVLETYRQIHEQELIRKRVTHHDTKISNVLFDPRNKGLCVIDLDTVMPGYFISDFGDMMRTYLSPLGEESNDLDSIEIRDDYFRAIAEGFLINMNNVLRQEEKKFIIYSGFFMIFMQAIRFLADYFNNDTYYGARYEDQNYVRAANQLTLLKRLDEKKTILESIISRI